MKKKLKYITPVIESCYVELSSLIAGSLETDNPDITPGGGTKEGGITEVD